jgi:ribulose-5-phosphate 4-epimerase/fuculose-1-phosphate aldolase
MKSLIDKYIRKLVSQGLADSESTIFLALDAELYSNKPLEGSGVREELEALRKVFDLMNINTILFSRPLEPYKGIIKELTGNKTDRIIPMDCETRTFFHDIPVIDEFSPEAISEALSHRKSAIIRDRGIITYGVVTPEQAFVSFSSTCFSTFVKYFYDSLIYFKECRLKDSLPDERYMMGFKKIISNLQPSALGLKPLTSTPPETEEDVIRMLSEAGRAVVEQRLVDSYFGNISYVFNKVIYISQTGSSLDELDGCIDAVPLDGSSSTGITASSELSAHKNIYYATGDNAILHGHPKFSVIMSLHCEIKDCPHYMDMDYCYRKCREKRYVAGVPVVSGEIGTGPAGLMNTVPEAMKEGKGTIVFGHGVFTSGRDDFNSPFQRLSEIEEECKKIYFHSIEKLGIIV